MEITANDDEHIFKLKLQHLSRGYMHGKGKWDPWHILKYAETARFLHDMHILQPLGDKVNTTFSEKFFRWVQLSFTEDYFEFGKIRERHEFIDKVNTPFEIDNKMVKVGNSSYFAQTRGKNVRTNKTLFYVVTQMVHVDLKLRKSTKFSKEENHELLRNLYTGDETYISQDQYHGLTQYETPSHKVFTHELCLPYSCLDINGHVNYAYYSIIALNSLYAVTKKSGFPHEGNFDDLLPHRMSFLYVGEAEPLNLLTVKIWQSLNEPLLFHFHSHVGQRLVNQCEILFKYSPTPKL